jgi:exodeoxyribonuclease VII small subunit
MMSEEALSFEEALAALEEVVAQLESGGLTLEETVALYERGQQLVALCNARLDKAELQIEQLSSLPDSREE